mgnify:CR=1 FL=1
MSDWNAALYSKFEKDRTLPSYDLVRAVDIRPKTVLDIGCGIGNSTAVLAEHFPEAHIVGADNSPDMLAHARRTHPSLEFIELDAAHGLPNVTERYDLVFSNACVQWLPDHKTILPQMLGLLNDGGVLAVQMPQQAKHPMHKLLLETARSPKWTAKIPSLRQYHMLLTEEAYFDLLAANSSSFRMWEVTYYHEMPSHESIVEWYKGTGLRPYLDQLSEADKPLFEADVLARVRELYPVQENGSIIFRFPRLFFTAVK